MKPILVLATIIIFASCTKDPIDLSNLRFPVENYTWNYPNYTPVDMHGKLDADIIFNGNVFHYQPSGYSAGIYRSVSPTNSDSGVIAISTSDSLFILNIGMVNVTKTGTYSFGEPSGSIQQISATLVVNGIYYNNNPDKLSGSIQIDSLTTNRIHGLFSMTLYNGADSVEITKGLFESDL